MKCPKCFNDVKVTYLKVRNQIPTMTMYKCKNCGYEFQVKAIAVKKDGSIID